MPVGRLLNRFLALMLAASTAFAQNVPAPSYPPPAFSQQELDQMLAPIALYPDSLLSQILMASTYPLEVVEAARWSKANPGLRGEDAVNAFASQPWDPSVKSLLAFPQILAMMDERLDWTQRLGDAFLAQEPQVMDTVQALRRRAYEAGNLRSSDQMLLTDQAGTIAIEPVNPQIVYVPYYDPLVVYGTWWWPAYPPIYWPAWPGYYVRPGFAPGFAWGVGVTVSVGFFFGAFDWHRHRVDVVNVNNFYYRGSRAGAAPGPWKHDAAHRRAVPYRTEPLRRQFGRPGGASAADTRREFRGREFPQGGSRTAPAVPPQVRGPATRGPASGAPRRMPVPESAPGAFEGIHSGGAQTRQFSTRGQGSMREHGGGERVAPGRAQPGPKGNAAPPGGGRGGSGPQHR